MVVPKADKPEVIQTGLAGSSPPCGKHPPGFSESDVGRLPDLECDIGPVMDTSLAIELETIRLKDDVIRDSCYFTMEESMQIWKKPSSNVMWCREKTWTQQEITFECTVSTQGSVVSIHSQGLRFLIGGAYWQSQAYDSTAARDLAGPILNRRIEYWTPGFHWRDVGWQDTWDSVMVESVRLVLRRWRGVCSFSQTRRSNRSDEDRHRIVDNLRSKNKVDLPARHWSGGPAPDFGQAGLLRLQSGREYDHAQIILKG